jgi:hypothetical protein
MTRVRGYNGRVRQLLCLLAHRSKMSVSLIPVACAVAGILVSLVTVGIDRSLERGDPQVEHRRPEFGADPVSTTPVCAGAGG